MWDEFFAFPLLSFSGDFSRFVFFSFIGSLIPRRPTQAHSFFQDKRFRLFNPRCFLFLSFSYGRMIRDLFNFSFFPPSYLGWLIISHLSYRAFAFPPFFLLYVS